MMQQSLFIRDEMNIKMYLETFKIIRLIKANQYDYIQWYNYKMVYYNLRIYFIA